MNGRKIRMAVFVFTVKTIGIRSFYGTKISKITVPSKTKTIGQGAFGSCKSLKTIVMPGDFKLKLEEDTDDKLWYVTSDQSAVDTITFNTKLKLAMFTFVEYVPSSFCGNSTHCRSL